MKHPEILFPGQAALPGPGGLEGFLNGAGGFPAHLCVGKGGIGPNCGDVSGTTWSKLVGNFHAVHFLEGVDQFQHGDRAAGADVEDLAVLLHLPFDHPRDREDMGPGEVHDVDVVAEAGAVGREVN